MRRIIAASIGLLLLAGCGSKVQKGGLSGTLTYKGEPVNNATLLLYPNAGAMGDAIPIPVGADGTFRSSGLPAGDYKVVVEGTAGTQMPNLKNVSPAKQAEAQKKLEAQGSTKPTIPFPDKYKDVKTSDLTVNITTAEQKLTLELKD
jgi:hypothetical protein